MPSRRGNIQTLNVDLAPSLRERQSPRMGLMKTDRLIRFDNSYSRLPERFFARLAPEPVAAPRLLHVNRAIADHLGVDADWLAGPEGVAFIAGNRVPDGADPIALAYAGHQFGHFVPQLGDGRAVLLGEVIGRDGERYDIQLKGSGRTPFSRSGDGRAAIGPILRELIVSEAVAALGVPTTRVLAAVATGQPVFRDSMLPGAVLARVARGHTRIGSFQYFAARRDTEALRILADYVIERQAIDTTGSVNRYVAMLDAAVLRTASLVADWQSIGFIHGVMNTDNMSLAGETIDYGPCAFMDSYHPGTVFSSIDQQGRYAYGNQPAIAHWNLAKLAEATLPLFAEEESEAVRRAQASIDAFPALFEAAYARRMTAKLGIRSARSGDMELLAEFLELMAADACDFTLAFRRLSLIRGEVGPDWDLGGMFRNREAFRAWFEKWRRRVTADEGCTEAERCGAMLAVNPAVIPRNHLVEEALADAEATGDVSRAVHLMDVLAAPFDEKHDNTEFALPPRAEQIVRATFCGT